ncbi:MAG: hypothetical protein HY318_13030 [Armatimonadetes bacterium]|nr:hypothetical protein [Armatimonadota bacterium]
MRHQNRQYIPNGRPGGRHKLRARFLPFCGALFLASSVFQSCFAERRAMTTRVDPVSRYIHLTYQVPADAPEEVVVLCSWSPIGTNDWRAAPVTP